MLWPQGSQQFSSLLSQRRAGCWWHALGIFLVRWMNPSTESRGSDRLEARLEWYGGEHRTIWTQSVLWLLEFSARMILRFWGTPSQQGSFGPCLWVDLHVCLFMCVHSHMKIAFILTPSLLVLRLKKYRPRIWMPAAMLSFFVHFCFRIGYHIPMFAGFMIMFLSTLSKSLASLH